MRRNEDQIREVLIVHGYGYAHAYRDKVELMPGEVGAVLASRLVEDRNEVQETLERPTLEKQVLAGSM